MPCTAAHVGPRPLDLSDRNVRNPRRTVGVSAGNGEDFVQFFAQGRGEGAVPYSVDEGDAAATMLEVLPENLPEVVELEVQRGPLGDALTAGNALDVKVDGEIAGRVLQGRFLLFFDRLPGRDGISEAPVFIGLMGMNSLRTARMVRPSFRACSSSLLRSSTERFRGWFCCGLEAGSGSRLFLMTRRSLRSVSFTDANLRIISLPAGAIPRKKW